jgi:SAM-dependent methyltransferase
VRDGDGVVSPFVMQLLPELYVLSDDLRAGGDAVMGASPSTKSLAVVARPTGRTGAALDLGCGAGTLALAMASKCDRVVATDVSERAVTLARLNAALNGLSNVECRAGDAYEPVRGERFDLVACQPPYVAREETAGSTTFLFGGPRGDEVAMRMLGGLRDHLAPGGLAFFMVEWPVVEADPPIDERVVAALASPELTLLLLQSPRGNLEEHCARYASIAHPSLGEDYERAAMRRRDHFERMNIRALQPSVAVVRRGAASLAWGSVVDVGNTPMSRPKVEAMLAARDLLGRGEDAVLAARLRVPDKAPALTDPILRAVVEAASVAVAIEALTRAPASVKTEEVLERVTQALLSGQLEVTAA